MVHSGRTPIPRAVQLLLLLGGVALLFFAVQAVLQAAVPSPRPLTPTVVSPTATPAVYPSPTPLPASTERADLAVVHSRVVLGLRYNNPAALFNELFPDSAAATDYPAFAQSFEEVTRREGPIERVDMVSPPVPLQDAPWEGNWAEATVDLVRGGVGRRYRVVYTQINGQWWLFGTIEVTGTLSTP